MNEHEIEKEIERSVLSRVKGGVRMRSRAYFVVRFVMAIIVAALALSISSFVLSFVAFSIHESGEQFLLGFGARGVATFFAIFPWGALLFDIVIICILEWLLQGFKFGYRLSLVSVFAAVFGASALVAGLINLTPIHMHFLDRADRGELPLIGEMYEGIRDPHEDHGVFRGTVVSIATSSVVITHDDGDHDADDGTRTVALPNGAPALVVGERVYVFGAMSSGTIEATGIEMLSPDQ